MSSQNRERGSITVVALLVLVVLTVLGITLTRTTTLDLRITTNEHISKQNFYVAEGGVLREAAEVGAGNYVVMDLNNPRTLADETGVLDENGAVVGALPGAAHQVSNSGYNFDVDYEGFALPPKGYSATQFSRYDYDIGADFSNINVLTRYCTIGPKAN